MKKAIIERIISECVREIIGESWFGNTATPHSSHSDAMRELGRNPLRTDVGGHSSREEVRQPSTFDRNGANFRGTHVILSDNKFSIYKIKNFGSLNIKDTLSLFGSGSSAEKGLRRAIDTLNGAADRNGKYLSYRTVTSESGKEMSERSGYMRGTFWEFSFNGNEWYILAPNPVQTMERSKLEKRG